MKPESAFQKKLITELKKRGWFYNTNDRFTSGIPDILGCYIGHLLAIECKINNLEPTPLQSLTLRNITLQRGCCFVAAYYVKLKEYRAVYINKETEFKTESLKELVLWILAQPLIK